MDIIIYDDYGQLRYYAVWATNKTLFVGYSIDKFDVIKISTKHYLKKNYYKKRIKEDCEYELVYSSF